MDHVLLVGRKAAVIWFNRFPSIGGDTEDRSHWSTWIVQEMTGNVSAPWTATMWRHSCIPRLLRSVCHVSPRGMQRVDSGMVGWLAGWLPGQKVRTMILYIVCVPFVTNNYFIFVVIQARQPGRINAVSSDSHATDTRGRSNEGKERSSFFLHPCIYSVL